MKAEFGYWVRFNAEGVPTSYSGAWFDGAEWVPGVTSATLDSPVRRVDGKWVPREPEPQPEPEIPSEPEPDPATLDIKAELAAIAERVAELQAALDSMP